MAKESQKLQTRGKRRHRSRASGGSSQKYSTVVRPSVVDREFSSGGVVYKPGVLWLIRSTRPSKLYPKSYWMLPKGRIDEREKVDEAAIREVGEEAGVEAKIVKKIETIKYFFKHPRRGNILKFVTYFLMEYVHDLPQGHDNETLEVLWLPFDEAYKKLTFAGEKQILKKAKQILI